MRELPDHDPTGPVATWLFALAGRRPPEHVPAVADEALDPIWRELSIRWPDGRHVHHRGRPVLRRLAVIAGALAVGVLVPLVVLGLPATPDDEDIESVRAQPLEEEPAEDPEPEDVPSFEFPDVTAGAAEVPTETLDDEPTAPIAPPLDEEEAPADPDPEPVVTEPPPPEPADPVDPVDPVPPPSDDGTADDGTEGSDGTADGSDDGTSDGGTTDGGEPLPVIGGGP